MSINEQRPIEDQDLDTMILFAGLVIDSKPVPHHGSVHNVEKALAYTVQRLAQLLVEAKREAHMVTEDQIKHMVDRFLCWKLPANFNPDAGITFKAEFNEGTQWPMKHEPSGTNLLDAVQADAMVRHMLGLKE